MEQLFHNPGLNHIGQQILNQVNTDIRIEPKDVSKTWIQIVDFVQRNEKVCLMYFYSNFGLNPIGRKILIELNFKGIQAARGVCKTWKNIIDDCLFWNAWNWKLLCSKIPAWKQYRYQQDEDYSEDYSDNDRMISGYRFSNIVFESLKVFKFNQVTCDLTKNAISLLNIRFLIMQKRKPVGDSYFNECMWAEITVKYLKMYKIHHLWASLLQIHTWKNMEKIPNTFRRATFRILNRELLESDLVEWRLKDEEQLDPLDDQIMALNNLTNFCLNPHLKQIGQKIFSYLDFKDQMTSRRVCFSFKKAIDIMWAENVGYSIPKFYSKLFYNRNSARKLIKQIKSAQKIRQSAKKRSGSPIKQQNSKKAKISWRPKDEETIHWTSGVSTEAKSSGKFGQISWKQNGDFELRWTKGL